MLEPTRGRNVSVNGFYVVTDAASKWFGAATWEKADDLTDSIGVSFRDGSDIQYLAPTIGSNRNPMISTSIWGMRFWSIWENNGTGSWKLFGSTILLPLGAVDEKPILGGFELLQSYPNPFNPKTKIVYRITSREFVELRVFDVLGREVATLLEAQIEPGTHTVEFRGDHLASGVYLYRLTAGNFSETKRLLLLK